TGHTGESHRGTSWKRDLTTSPSWCPWEPDDNIALETTRQHTTRHPAPGTRHPHLNLKPPTTSHLVERGDAINNTTAASD
ncbi:hypothetical protein QR685DRAFT_451596, partial [Neurospora intermedia]